MQNKGWWIFGGIVAVAVLGVLGYFGVRNYSRNKKLAPFKEHLATYLAAPKSEGNLPFPPDKAAQPVKGRIIVVDVDKKEVDDFYWDMPEDLRADTPADVGTIVQLTWGKRKVGEYTGGSIAEQQFVEVKVIDKASGLLTHATRIEGGPPPQSKKSSESGVGSKPTKELVTFLKNLPRS